MSRKIKKVVSVVLLFATVLGLIFALVKCSEIEKRDIYPVFAVGGLNDEGNYLKTTDSIYTKDPFDCRGLTVTPGFTSNIKYQVFFYGEQGQFVGKSELLEGAAVIPMSDLAVQARLVIIPFDDDGKNVEIKLWDVPKYSMMAKITVDADQDYEVPNLVELAKQNKYIGTTAVSELKPQQILEQVNKKECAFFENTFVNNDSSKSGETINLCENNAYDTFIFDCSKVKSYIFTPEGNNKGIFHCSLWTYNGSLIETNAYAYEIFNKLDTETIGISDGVCYAVFYLEEGMSFDLSVYEYRSN